MPLPLHYYLLVELVGQPVSRLVNFLPCGTKPCHWPHHFLVEGVHWRNHVEGYLPGNDQGDVFKLTHVFLKFPPIEKRTSRSHCITPIFLEL